MKKNAREERMVGLVIIIFLGLVLACFFGLGVFFPEMLQRMGSWKNFMVIIAIAVSLPFWGIAIGKEEDIKKGPLKFSIFYSIISMVLSTIFLYQVSLLIGKPADIANIRLSFFILFAGMLSGALCARYVQTENEGKT